MDTQHVHTDELDIALADGECGVQGPCEGYHNGCMNIGTCQVDPYAIDVDNEIEYRILCQRCADQIADDI